MEGIFKGLFDSDLVTVIDVTDFLICILGALIIGLMIALAYSLGARCTKSFVVTLALLPAVVCVVIMMVNGNVGTGVAVAGAFSLVRFRSVPGTAKEICTLFLAMSAGIIVGMGYIGFGLLFSKIMCIIFTVYNRINFGAKKGSDIYKTLTVTIPEDLNYSDIFEDIFCKYTVSHELIKVKSTNMGSMFKLTYNMALKDTAREKEMIDAIRCRNGNLEISIFKQDSAQAEL